MAATSNRPASAGSIRVTICVNSRAARPEAHLRALRAQRRAQQLAPRRTTSVRCHSCHNQIVKERARRAVSPPIGSAE